MMIINNDQPFFTAVSILCRLLILTGQNSLLNTKLWKQMHFSTWTKVGYSFTTVSGLERADFAILIVLKHFWISHYLYLYLLSMAFFNYIILIIKDIMNSFGLLLILVLYLSILFLYCLLVRKRSHSKWTNNPIFLFASGLLHCLDLLW
jgi:hypothetical protein